MRALIALTLAGLFLSACSTLPSNSIAAKPTNYMDSYAVATLEPAGSCAWKIAADVTANASERRRSAKLTDAGQLSSADLRRVIVLHDKSRAALERACAAGPASAPSESALKESRALRAEARSIMERK